MLLKKIKTFLKGYANIMTHGKTKDKILSWFIVIMLVMFLGYSVSNTLLPSAIKDLPTSEFITELRNNNVETLRISTADGSVDGKLRQPTGEGVTNFKTNMPPGSDAVVKMYLETSDVEYTYNKPSSLVSLLMSIFMIFLQVGLIFGAMMLLFRGNGMGSIFPFGNKGMEINSYIPDTTFNDVVGVPEAVEEMQEIVTFLKNPDAYDEAGAKFPHGILLQGPAGSGKTLLARALAGEAGVPFISVAGSEFIEMYVGVGANRVRQLFAAARENQPSILFIDEIDAIGGKRDNGPQTNDERLQTLNQLLTEMDGFDNSSEVIVIAATNRGDSLDDALLRPGRLDRIITVDQPAKEGRMEILQYYAQGKPFAERVDFNELAAHTYGFSGAQLENVMNQAATLAARRANEEGVSPLITKEDLEEGISRTISGPAMKSKKISDEEKRQVAYHEAGHALVQYLLPECDEVQKISIVSRAIAGVGTALGYVQSYSETDRYVTTADKCSAEIAALLAGRASEKMFCQIESAGANDDLKKASSLAYRMVDEFAFTAEVGSSSLRVQVRDNTSRMLKVGSNRLNLIDDQVDDILRRQYNTATRILSQNSARIHMIVDVLLEKENIDATGIKEIMSQPIEEDIDSEYY